MGGRRSVLLSCSGMPCTRNTYPAAGLHAQSEILHATSTFQQRWRPFALHGHAHQGSAYPMFVAVLPSCAEFNNVDCISMMPGHCRSEGSARECHQGTSPTALACDAHIPLSCGSLPTQHARDLCMSSADPASGEVESQSDSHLPGERGIALWLQVPEGLVTARAGGLQT